MSQPAEPVLQPPNMPHRHRKQSGTFTPQSAPELRKTGADLPSVFRDTLTITGNLEQTHYTITYEHLDANPNAKLVQARTVALVLARKVNNVPIYLRAFGAGHTFMGAELPVLDRAYKFYKHAVGKTQWTLGPDDFKALIRQVLGHERMSLAVEKILLDAQLELVEWKVWADVVGSDGVGTIKTLERVKFMKPPTRAEGTARKLIPALVNAIQSDDEGDDTKSQTSNKTFSAKKVRQLPTASFQGFVEGDRDSDSQVGDEGAEEEQEEQEEHEEHSVEGTDDEEVVDTEPEGSNENDENQQSNASQSAHNATSTTKTPNPVRQAPPKALSTGKRKTPATRRTRSAASSVNTASAKRMRLSELMSPPRSIAKYAIPQEDWSDANPFNSPLPAAPATGPPIAVSEVVAVRK
ncbi:hypothetical protein BC832DRAFT_564702 [Gaertneriomyces semiglobifer]|nr:hypothetical protein BC832DRAFT_564702 [Gaertneriomyces semiglobifer]